MSQTTVSLRNVTKRGGSFKSPSFQSHRPSLSESEVVERFLAALDCPRALTIWLLYKSGEHDQITRLGCRPVDYNSPSDFRDAFWATSYLSKYPYLATSFDRRKVALDSFWEAEAKCAGVNRSFQPYGINLELFNTPGYGTLIESVRRKVSHILGRFDVTKMLDSCRFGPGVSNLVKGADVSSSRKYSDERGITRDAYALFGEVLKSYCPRWITEDFNFISEKGTRIVTVPKNAKTDRTIGIEPGLNLWLQLGVGSMIRRALLKQGINLNSDEFNRLSALKGSIDDSLATEDFRQASDSISTSVVRYLLPNDWYTVLNAIRSHCFSLDGENWSVSSKFSTMGNGFTFELESLIFYCIATEVTKLCNEDPSLVGIFGDDVVLPSKASAEFRKFSALLGFNVNPEKSFNQGSFRESCGAYFYGGVDVKPLYLRGRVRSLSEVFTLANGLRRAAHRSNVIGCDVRFRPFWNFLVHRIPETFRRFGPLELGDSVLTENPELSLRHQTWDGWLVPAFPVRPVVVQHDGFGHLLARLRHISTQHRQDTILLFNRTTTDGNDVPLRGRAKIFYKKIFCPRWYDMGPWL